MWQPKFSMRKLAGIGCAATLAMAAGQAQAVIFDVSEAGGWTSTDSAEVTLINPAPNVGEAVAPAGTYTTSQWLLNSPTPSQLVFEFFNRDIEVGYKQGSSGTVLLARLYHYNNVLRAEEAGDPNFSFPFTHTENFALNFVIAEGGNESNHLFVDNPTGFVTHTETLNQAPCAPFNNPTGPAGSVCDDTFAFNLDLSPGMFSFDGGDYEISFQLVSSELNQDPLVFIDGLIYTPENNRNVLDVFLTITRTNPATFIPEPGVLALLGLGLLGLGLNRRRTKLGSR